MGTCANREVEKGKGSPVVGSGASGSAGKSRVRLCSVGSPVVEPGASVSPGKSRLRLCSVGSPLVGSGSVERGGPGSAGESRVRLRSVGPPLVGSPVVGFRVGRSAAAVVLALLVATAFGWGGCKRQRDGAGGSRGTKGGGKGGSVEQREALLVKASRALERKRYERAVELAFRGYKRWLRRAGGRAGRIRGYREILHATVDRGKGKVVLNRCQRAKSAFEDRACERFLLEHLKRGAAVEEGREKAIGLFCAACLDKKAILSHFKDVCAQLPAGLALSEPLRAKLDELLQTRCASKDLKRAESALCKRVGFIFWKHARASGDHRRLASLVPALLRLAPSATWKRLLTDLADDSLPKSARLVFEGVFLRQAGGSGEARALAEVFLERLEPGERRSLIRRYLTVAKGKVPEAASVLAQVDFSTALEVIKEIAKSDVKGAGALAEKLSNRVSSSPLAVLREYVSIRRESSDLRKKALSLLAAHPDVVYQHVVSRIASTPLPQRNRLRRLTGELRPKALYGEVKGKLIKKKAHLMTVPCKVQLVELSSCDVREPVGPDRAGKARGRGKGAGVRIKRTVEVDENRKYRFERLPVAPYEMFVWCPDGLGWRRVRFGGFEIGEDGKPVWKGRCMVTSAPLKVVRALPVHLDRPWRLDHPPPVNSSSKHGGGSGRVKPKLPPKRAAPLF